MNGNNLAIALVEVRWVSWCRRRSGDDGRRPSGVGYTRGKYRHAIPVGTQRSLCKRDVNCFPSEKDDLPKCPVCVKRAQIGDDLKKILSGGIPTATNQKIHDQDDQIRLVK